MNIFNSIKSNLPKNKDGQMQVSQSELRNAVSGILSLLTPNELSDLSQMASLRNIALHELIFDIIRKSISLNKVPFGYLVNTKKKVIKAFQDRKSYLSAEDQVRNLPSSSEYHAFLSIDNVPSQLDYESLENYTYLDCDEKETALNISKALKERKLLHIRETMDVLFPSKKK